MDKVTEAAIEFLKRKSITFTDSNGRTITHSTHYPQGIFRKGKWYPHATEIQPCCLSIREPSRTYPWSLHTHCRSLKHVCQLYNVEESEVKFICSKKGLPLLVGTGDPWVDKYLESKFKKE